MISVVIPNFNGGKRLVENLQKLLGLLDKSKLDYEVIVSDDASTDDSTALLTGFHPVRLVTSKINTGFGANVDRGIREAKGEVVFVLNAIDILPESADYFKIMLAHFGLKKNRSLEKNDSSKIFAVAAAKKDEQTHGCGEIYFGKGFFLHRRKAMNGALRQAQGSPTSDVKIYSGWADGGAQALRKSYYLKLGGFDPLYKFYWEDTDLGYRAWKAGFTIEYEPKAVLFHQKAEGPIAKYYSLKECRTMNLRNQFIFTWKNADFKHFLLYELWEPYHFAVALKNRDWAWFKAYFQAILKWPTILLRRIKQRSQTVLSDDQILAEFK